MYSNGNGQITNANGECKIFYKAYDEIVGEWIV
jgi:hypothetical protein